ncbi:MAG: DEAD/DEAH box helicase [Verrucomicrobia bacterium]|nr:DEAD/DEAH box helicase [Verrucomicrobiota bacterium]
MSDMYELVNAQDAADYLEEFSSRAIKAGELCFRTGRVQQLRCVEPGLEYEAIVVDGEEHSVHLECPGNESWIGWCSCSSDDGDDCPHLYAAMKALLAEHNLSTVRSLSTGKKPALLRRGAAERTQNGSAGHTSLADTVARGLGRSLKPQERVFLQRLNEVYTRVCQTRLLNQWDLDELGLNLGGYGWNTLQLWPAFPETEHEFWLYVAHALESHGKRLPEFMKPVSDLGPVQEKLRKWNRSRSIERWTESLQGFRAERHRAAAGSGAYDLRWRLLGENLELEWRRPGRDGFEAVKPAPLRQFHSSYRDGSVELTPEAGLLWQVALERGYNVSPHPRLSLADTAALRLVGRLLRHPTLRERLIAANGLPLEHAHESLAWVLTPAENDDDDYRLRLVKADGTPAPSPLWVLPGEPPLYLSSSAVYHGPPAAGLLLDVRQENLIPAPALETQPGVELLRSLGLDMPPRVQERVRQVPLRVAVRCELQPTYPGSKTEVCQFYVLAESEDGVHREQWNGESWIAVESDTRRKRKTAPALVYYDRTDLDRVPRAMEPLGLRWEAYYGYLSLRVTRQFPETFAAWLKTVPPEIHLHLVGDLATLAQQAVAGKVRLEATETTIDWFDLKVVLDASDTTLSPEELKLLLDAKGRYVRLPGKGWRRLQFDLSEEEDERLARLGLTPHELTSEPQRLHALQLADDAAKKFLPELQAAQIQRRASEIQARVTPALPAGVTANLRPYQLEGYHFLAYLAANRFGGILADDMGLGKTLQALAWLVWLRTPATPAAGGNNGDRPNPGCDPAHPAADPAARTAPDAPLAPVLVVCPKSVMDNWRAEVARFTPQLRVKLWPASELNAFHEHLDQADLHVVNYSQLRLLGESLVPIRWHAVILDEGQYIKNPGSQTAQVARALRAENRLVLSGTPIENRLMDLWSLMAFVMPGVLGSRQQFGRLYDRKDDPFARRRLAARVRPFLLRRTKGQVAKDLPDRIEEDLYCEIEGEQKLLYRAELKRAQQLLLGIQTPEQLAQQQFHFLASLMRLRQICCHPALAKPDSRAESAKVGALLDQLGPLMEEGHKVLVFSQFVELLKLLKPMLEELGWPVYYLTGETENRGELVQRFQTAPGSGVFLISLRAGGFGLNLTAASYVILFDPWWNPAVENQAIDRTHRIGQVNKVLAYRLLIKDSIEEKIRALQRQKSALAEDVLGEEKFAQSLTLDDLQYLLAD